MLFDQNYGHGIYGLYSSAKYQHVWSMGTAYKQCADGTGLGNLYGLSYTHTNVGGSSIPGLSHQLLFVHNGNVHSAVGSGMWTCGVSCSLTCFKSPIVCATTCVRVGSTGTATIKQNASYPTLELQAHGNELMIGAGGPDIHINYRATTTDTPDNWYWRAGSSTSYSNHNWGIGCGHTRLESPIVCGACVYVTGALRRTAHHTGHLEGSYNNVGDNVNKSNPIYTIGSNYNPTDAALSNMYGIGYSHTNASFITGALSHGGWGMYVASDGDARIWLEAGSGIGAACSCWIAPVICGTSCVISGNSWLQSTCIKGPIVCATTCVQAPLFCGNISAPATVLNRFSSEHGQGGNILIHYANACVTYNAWTVIGSSEPGYSYNGSFIGNNICANGSYYGVQCAAAGTGTGIRMWSGNFEVAHYLATQGAGCGSSRLIMFAGTSTGSCVNYAGSTKLEH